ncbi:unnamed protein product [Symbiodinium sp. KB8]|nr:unnamed protein product [Symbiodinium sp. KB8]
MAEPDVAQRRKRSLEFHFVDTFVCPKVEDVREAARLWASKNHEVVGSFRQPYLLPSMQMRTTAACHKCKGCHRFDGKMFEFLACDSEDKAFTNLTATAEERNLVHKAADFLIQQNLKATPTAVHVRLAAWKKPRVLDNVVRAILRWRRKKLSFTTWKCLESEGSFRAMAADKQDPDHGELCFAHMDIGPGRFTWICVLVPFFAALQQTHEQGGLQPCCLTGDFTFRVEILGYCLEAVLADGAPRKRTKTGKLKKRPPHFKNRPVYAFLNLTTQMLLHPSKAFYHICASKILARIFHIWKETEWVQYYRSQYMRQVPTQDSEQEGCQHFLTSTWWFAHVVYTGPQKWMCMAQAACVDLDAVDDDYDVYLDCDKAVPAAGMVTIDLVERVEQIESTPTLRDTRNAHSGYPPTTPLSESPSPEKGRLSQALASPETEVASLLVLPGGFDRKMLVSGDVAEKLLRMGLVEEIQSGVGGRQYAVASPLAEMPPHEQWTQLEKAWPSDDVRHKRMMKMAEAHKDPVAEQEEKADGAEDSKSAGAETASAAAGEAEAPPAGTGPPGTSRTGSAQDRPSPPPLRPGQEEAEDASTGTVVAPRARTEAQAVLLVLRVQGCRSGEACAQAQSKSGTGCISEGGCTEAQRGRGFLRSGLHLPKVAARKRRGEEAAQKVPARKPRVEETSVVGAASSKKELTRKPNVPEVASAKQKAKPASKPSVKEEGASSVTEANVGPVTTVPVKLRCKLWRGAHSFAMVKATGKRPLLTALQKAKQLREMLASLPKSSRGSHDKRDARRLVQRSFTIPVTRFARLAKDTMAELQRDSRLPVRLTEEVADACDTLADALFGQPTFAWLHPCELMICYLLDGDHKVPRHRGNADACTRDFRDFRGVRNGVSGDGSRVVETVTVVGAVKAGVGEGGVGGEGGHALAAFHKYFLCT